MTDTSKLPALFMTFLLMIVGLALTPTVAEQATAAALDLDGAAQALMKLVPLFWVIIILAIGVAAVYYQFKGGD